MKNNQWRSWIRRELMREEVEPSAESFYQGVWNRIRAAESASPAPVRNQRLLSIGGLCWRSAPVLAGLLLVLSLYIWYHSLDLRPEIMDSAESFVLDADEAPSDDVLLYQIMHATPVSELETKQ